MIGAGAQIVPILCCGAIGPQVCVRGFAKRCRHIGSTVAIATAVANVSVGIDVSNQSERTECLSNVLVTACRINGTMVLPVAYMGPHHRVVVLVVFAFVVGVGHVERVRLTILQRPCAVGIVVVVVRSTPNAVWAGVQYGEFVEVALADTLFVLSVTIRVGLGRYVDGDGGRVVVYHHVCRC